MEGLITSFSGTSLTVNMTYVVGTASFSSWSITLSGAVGTSGYSGFSGISGYSGSGVSGYSGFSGISGYSGSGVSGYSGFSGAIGASGFSGYSGTNGASGFSGYSGYSGISGYSGYSGSGISGYSGYSGSGLSGFSGYSGISGYSGGGGGSGTVNSGTQYQLGYYASTGTAISGNSNIKTDANSNLNLAATGATLNSANTFGFKNRIINGGMVIDQRNAGAAQNNLNGGGVIYLVDRWSYYGSQYYKFNSQQTPSATETGYSTRVGAGFTNYLALTSTSAYTLSGDFFQIAQSIEGFNVADLAWGTASAKTVTLSFWVYSSLTGTFGGTLNGGQYYPFSYSIPTANTWTKISVTVTGSTSGSWGTGNSSSIGVVFSLGADSSFLGTAGAWTNTVYRGATGQVNVVSTSGATFYITGVQLEVGSQATSFDFRDYGRELALCQRYFVSYGGVSSYELMGNGVSEATNQCTVATYNPVPFRTSPSVYGSLSSTLRLVGATGLVVTAVSINQNCSNNITMLNITATGTVAGNAYYLGANASSSARLQFSAEL